MRTRCPGCGTQFRVTSEQLRQKFGKVRCGECQAVFNAFDHWIGGAEQNELREEEKHESELLPAAPLPIDEEIEADSFALSSEVPADHGSCADRYRQPFNEADQNGSEATSSIKLVSEPIGDGFGDVGAAESTPESGSPDVGAGTEQAAPAEFTAPSSFQEQNGSAEDKPIFATESLEESTLAARAAGLVAARELNETVAYSRWAAGTLALDGGGLGIDETKPFAWPYILMALVFALVLGVQAAYFYRSEWGLRWPVMRGIYERLGINLPLPHESALVGIDASDLQADTARGLFVLQATLKNRASFDQAWPALELSLTDVNDKVVLRRVMTSDDYLNAETGGESFQANREIAIRLWIEAKEIVASGYRLYVFYP